LQPFKQMAVNMEVKKTHFILQRLNIIDHMKTISKLTLPVIIASISLNLAACSKERINGNGNVISETRGTSDFSRIVSRGEFIVTIVPDSVTSARVEAESNIIPYVNTSVNGSTIIIDFDDNVNIHEHSAIRVILHTPHAEYLELQGSGSITNGNFSEDGVEICLSGSGDITSSFNSNSLSASISGSGSITLEGLAHQTSMHVSGSGNIRALNLTQDICNASISGSGDIYVNVTQKIVATISGSGSVYYTGDPLVESHISGSGKVEKY
jgi:hypothetical protein